MASQMRRTASSFIAPWKSFWASILAAGLRNRLSEVVYRLGGAAFRCTRPRTSKIQWPKSSLGFRSGKDESVIISKAPAKDEASMNLKTFRLSLCVLIVIGAASSSPVRAGLRDNNLIEISGGSYAWRTRTALLWPPFVKIYQDGKVVHYHTDENKFYVSHLDTQTLDTLKERLSSEHYLRR